MTDPRCGCCTGTGALTPVAAGNRPGLDAIRYRVGTHGTFLETMLAALSSHRLPDGRRPLERLTTRAPSDPAIALLDAWATVADVLTFYQERIANEGYLLTATERRSVLELARLVGYRLRPGVAASVFLAFTLEKDYRVDVPAGTRAQSVPGPGELPQFFETDEALPARTEWNAIPARITRPAFLRPDASFPGTRRLRLEGAVTTLRVNDAILFACGATLQPYRVQSVEADAAAGHTLVTYAPFDGLVPLPPPPPPPGGVTPPGNVAEAPAPALARLADVVAALRVDASVPPPSRFQLARSAAQTYSALADLGPRLLTAFDTRLGDTLYGAYAGAPVTGASGSPCAVEAFGVQAGPYGSSAPRELVFDDNVLTGRQEWALAELKATLGVELSSSDATLDLTAAYAKDVDFAAAAFPPLAIRVTVGDELGGASIDAAPGELAEVTPAPPRKRLFARTYPVRGASVTVAALYDAFEGVGRLDELAVRYAAGGEVREATVQISVDLPARNVQAEATGTGRLTLAEGQTVTPVLTDAGRRVTFALSQGFTRLRVAQEESHFPTAVNTRLLALDNVYEGIVPGSRVMVDRPDRAPELSTVESVRTLSRADYGVSARVTQLLLDRPWLGGSDRSLAVLRGTTVYARSEALPLDEEVIETDVSGDVIELDGLYDGLEAGRWLMVKGVRTDVPGVDGDDAVEASELAMLAGVAHDVQTVTDDDGEPVIGADGLPLELPGDTLHTRVILSQPLAYRYRRDRFTINANVVRATHGETKTEVLGSGDGRIAFQEFTLKQKPLTYLPAPTPSGVESTLEVRVSEVRWPERETLLYLGPGERGYATRTDDEGKTTVVFGDGVRGTRLPTGVENVSAVYRAGIGKGGNVGAGELSVLATRPLGVKEVVNPQRATGGADPESRDQARRNVPVAVLALDRLVSVQDYTDFARVFAGIGKASATTLSDGRRQVVHLTIAGADDIPIDPASELFRNLLLALAGSGDASVPVQVAVREAVFLFVSARVKVAPDYRWDEVEPRVRATLLEAFAFDRRELGEDVLLSRVIATVQAVAGVDYVDVDLLDGVSESDAASPAALAARLESLAAPVATPPAGAACAATTRPRRRVAVAPARVDPTATDPELRLRPAQIAYLNPALPDTLVLTEVTS